MTLQIQQYSKNLLENIPLSKYLGIQISDLSDKKVVLFAPLQENINYEGVAFGGSLNAVAVLSCYLTLHHLLKSQNLSFTSLVIQSSEIKYLLTTDRDFFCTCELPKEETLSVFKNALSKKGRARLALSSEIRCQEGEPARVLFQGNFVVKR